MCCYPFCWGWLLGSCCGAAAADATAMQRHYYYTDGGQVVYIRGHALSGTEPRTVYVVKAEPLGEVVK